MVADSGRIAGYLERLSLGIEALGAEEAADVVAEVSAHLTDAVADAGGDEEAVLALFGTADALAVRILEERGIVAGSGTLPAASAGRQWAAVAADVFVWAAGTVGAYLAALFLAFRSLDLLLGLQALSSVDPGALARGLSLAVDMLVLAAAGMAGWWLFRLRRTPGEHSPGMRLLGLRRVRLGQMTRLVRSAQIPGARRGMPVLPAVALVAAVVILFGFGSLMSASGTARNESALITAVGEASGAVRTVTGVYQRVVRAMPATATVDAFLPKALPAMSALDARRAKGDVASYAVANVGLTDATMRVGTPASGQSVGAVVTVEEFGSVSETIHTTWDYRLVYADVTNADGSSGPGWRITSVERSQVDEGH